MGKKVFVKQTELVLGLLVLQRWLGVLNITDSLCVFMYMLNSENRNIHLTGKVRTFLVSGACCCDG